VTSAPRSVAIVGAGVAGLACADTLARAGAAVAVFEKARGPGGRISARRGEAGTFDHGAQYFTARDPEFAKATRGWIEEGVVAPWTDRIVALAGGSVAARPSDAQRFVATPRMSSLARHLARTLDVRCGVRIEALEGQAGRWSLRDTDGKAHGPFEAVAVATPAPQARPLLAPVPELAARASGVEMAPCLAAMVGFEADVGASFDAAFVEASPLSWVARDSSKPERDEGERWVLHASAGWSATHLETEPERFAGDLVSAFGVALGRLLPAVKHLAGQRWRFARVTRPLATSHLYAEASGLGACGDWCGGDRVESAWASGVALGVRMLGGTE
jgi:predicted NAD/FAD-dependent oxidoreductase